MPVKKSDAQIELNLKMTLPNRRRKSPKFENKTVISNSIEPQLNITQSQSMSRNQLNDVSYNQWGTPLKSIEWFSPLDILTFFSLVVPEMDAQDLMTKKEYISTHPLFPPMLKLLDDCRKEGYLGQMQIPQLLKSNELVVEQYAIDSFLEENNITEEDLESYRKEANIDEFIMKLNQLKVRYSEELEKLKNVCHEFKERLMQVLQEQSVYRPVLEEEVELKSRLMNQKFNFILSQLKKNVCNAVLLLMKQYDCPRKKRRQLSKNATEVLNTWFMDHIKDPYPNDSEKQELYVER